MTFRTITIVLPLLLAALWVAMMAAGTGPVDRAVLHFFYAADQPVLRAAARTATLVGEWQSMLLLVAITTVWLLYRRSFRTALLFAGVTLSGRFLILLQKEAIGRMRPDAEEHLVAVRSLSFPSAHTANSMIVFLALALIVAGESYRGRAVAAALIGTLIVGLSRPMLGVHWPSDVIAGWSFGALWVLVLTTAARTKARGSRGRED